MKKRSTGICAEENLCDATAFRMSSARENLIRGIKTASTPGRIFAEETISPHTMTKWNMGFKPIVMR